MAEAGVFRARERGVLSAEPANTKIAGKATGPPVRVGEAGLNRRKAGPQVARTVREQQDKRREEKLKQVQEQVDDGSLKIRKMTKKERNDNPPVPRKEKKKR